MIYKWACNSCGRDVDVERRIADCAVGPEENCECGLSDWRRVFEAPMMMERALPDGTSRPGFAREKEAAKLEVLAASAPPKQAAELKKAAMERRKSKE